MNSFPEPARSGAELAPDTLEILQSATRVLTGVALRSLDVLDGAVTLPQFRILAVLADFGRAQSGHVARTLGIETSAVTRFADHMVAAGYASRDGAPDHLGEAILELSASGEDLVGRVADWRERELARIARGSRWPSARSSPMRYVSSWRSRARATGRPRLPHVSVENPGRHEKDPLAACGTPGAGAV